MMCGDPICWGLAVVRLQVYSLTHQKVNVYPQSYLAVAVVPCTPRVQIVKNSSDIVMGLGP